MVTKFHDRFWQANSSAYGKLRALSGPDSKSRKKEMGTELSKLNEQAKRLKSSLRKTLEQGYYHRYPGSTVAPAAVRRMLVEAEREFEDLIIQITRDRRKALFYGEIGKPAKLKS